MPDKDPRTSLTHRTWPHAVLYLLVGIFLGVGWFLVLFGPATLRFSYVGWRFAALEDGLAHPERLGYGGVGDGMAHQLGWEWFREEPWTFPLGKIQSLVYPFGTSATMMDSIPLLAIPFKLLSPWLGRDFQYFGLWAVMCIVGQVLMGILILREFTLSPLQRILAGSLLTLSPPMLIRVFLDESLAAHWVLLAGTWFILLEYRGRLWRGAWPLLFAAAVLIQVYLVPMLAALWGISLYLGFRRTKSFPAVIIQALAGVVVLGVVAYSIGLIGGTDPSLPYGIHSWNLNGFVNSQGWSAFLAALPLSPTQGVESFAYLGLGNLLLAPVGLFLARKDFTKKNLELMFPFGVVVVILTLYALSNRAFLGSMPLWNISLSPIVAWLLGIFRASGRFIWPVFYFIVLLGIVSVVRHSRWAAVILAAAVILQFADVARFTDRIAPNEEYHTPLKSKFWNEAAQANEHIVLFPAQMNGLSAAAMPFGLYSRQYHMTLNTYYTSRPDWPAVLGYLDTAWEGLQIGKADPATLYVFWTPDWQARADKQLKTGVLVCGVDGYIAVISRENRLLATDFDVARYCLDVPPTEDARTGVSPAERSTAKPGRSARR